MNSRSSADESESEKNFGGAGGGGTVQILINDDDNAQFNIDAEVTNYFSNGDDTSSNKHGCLKRGSELKDFVKTDDPDGSKTSKWKSAW